MPDELFNPAAAEGQPLGSVVDAVEAAACIDLARWLRDSRPDIVAVHLEGEEGGLWSVEPLITTFGVPSTRRISAADDPELWRAACHAWELLSSLGRTERRVVAADEAERWTRGWP